MPSEVYVQGQRIRFTPAMSIGKGGEADIYQITKDLVVKVFKQADHADVAGNVSEELAARQRLAEHQKKLRQFPKLPVSSRVVVPIDLATDKSGREVLGYTMRLVKDAEVMLRYSERSYRGTVLENNKLAAIFTQLHQTVKDVHQAGVVIGDFNDLNVLVQKDTPWLIDADSFQFDGFLCKVYTERYVDPVLCSPKERRPVLAKPHTKESDWYAYSVMLFRSLLLCDPYGGVYKPKKGPDVLHAERPLKRISVFSKDVRYPRPAVPFDLLSDDLLQWFHEVFEEDVRKEFPIRHLQNFRWSACKNCRLEHARPTCPVCRVPAPAHVCVREATQVRGKVTSTRVFKTAGQVVHAAWQNGKLCYVYCVQDEVFGEYTYRREDDRIVIGSDVPLRYRWRTQGSRTIFGLEGKLQVHEKNEPDETPTYVDTFGGQPVYDANETNRFWVTDGVLHRNGDLGPERIGDVLENQTLFWVGDKFGFGFYRAGDLSVAFVFDSEKGGLNDGVKLPALRGQLVDALCYLSGSLAWFLVSMKEGSKLVNRAFLVSRSGEVQAEAEAEEGDGSWLGSIHGKCASGDFLFSVTEEGLVRITADGSSIRKTAEFPDTEPFVHSGCSIFPAKGGLYVVDRQEIRLLKIG